MVLATSLTCLVAYSNRQSRRFILAFLGMVAGCLIFISSVQAQFKKTWAPEQLNTDQSTNLFASWEGRQPVQGFILDLPADWRIDKALIIERNRMQQIPLRIDRIRGNRFQAEAPRPIQGQHDLIFQVQTGTVTGRQKWSLVPFTVAQERDREVVQSLDGYREDYQVQLRHRVSIPGSGALQLPGESGSALLLQRNVLPQLNGEAPFTVEFWLQTVRLNQVALSTWNGDEQQSYPFEFVIDSRGHLLLYRGRPGQHLSMATPRPIADGLWHHIALIYQKGEAQLVLDGTPVAHMNIEDTGTLFNVFPVAVGGRYVTAEKNEDLRFEGLIDEIRFWSWNRLPADILRSMYQPMETDGKNPIVLGFDDVPRRALVVTPQDQWNRVPSDLPFLYPVTRLRAELQEDTIELEWKTQAIQNQRFEVERSYDGRTFETLHTITVTRSVDEPLSTQSYSYSDFTIAPHQGVCFYRIRQQFDDGHELISKTLKISMVQEVPATVSLIGNTPNPFSTSTMINYEVKETDHIMLSIWDVSGHQVGMLVNQVQDPGLKQAQFVADNLPSGTYFIRLQTTTGTQTGKMLLTK